MKSIDTLSTFAFKPGLVYLYTKSNQPQPTQNQPAMKKIKPFLHLLVPLAFVVLSGCAALKSTGGKAGTEINYRMNPGQVFTMTTEATTVITTKNSGQTVTVDMASMNETLYRALAVNPDGTLTLEMEYKNMKQTAKTPMGDGETDFSTWTGKKTRFNISPRGALSEYAGFDQLPEITTATGEKVNGDMIQKSISTQFFELPDHPVRIGESWTVKTTNDIPYGGGTLKQEETTTFTVLEKVNMEGMDCLKINAEGTGKLSGVFEQMGTQLELTRDSKSTGTIYFAVEKGMYIFLESTSASKGQVYVPAAAMTIPQDISSKMSLKVNFN